MDVKGNKRILDYVNQEWRSFAEKPFNDVDSLILSQMSYIRFNGLIGSVKDGREPVMLWELLKGECFEKMFSNMLFGEKSKELLFAVTASPRFREIRLNYYDEKTDSNAQKQFASVSFLLPGNMAYVAFRGTDTSIIGWKEDFNMAFMREIPSQKAAVKQLKAVGEKVVCPLMVGGHSKGGNLAIYAGANCSREIFERITTIYSHDGPGFRKDVINKEGFKKAAKKTRKTVPEFSLIGMLLQNQDNYRVVQSDEKFLMQHNPFSWEIGREDFVYADEVAQGASLISDSISQWLENIDDAARERFIDVLFQVIEASGINDVTDFESDRLKNALAIVEALKEVEPQTRRFVFHTVHALASLSVKNIRQASRKRVELISSKEVEQTDNQN